MYPSQRQQDKKLYALVIRIEFLASTDRASQRAFFRRMVKQMRASDLITVHSRNWCVNTTLRPGDIRTQRLDLARWLLGQSAIRKFMVSEPLAIDQLMRCEPTWEHEDVWRHSPRDVCASNAPALLTKLAQHSLIRGVQALARQMRISSLPTVDDLIERMASIEDGAAIGHENTPPAISHQTEPANSHERDHVQPPPREPLKKAREAEKALHTEPAKESVCLFSVTPSKTLSQHQRKNLFARMRRDLAREGIAFVSFRGLCLATSTIGLDCKTVEQEVLAWTLDSFLVSQVNFSLQTTFYGLFTSRLVLVPNSTRSSKDHAAFETLSHKLVLMSWILAWKVLGQCGDQEGVFRQVLDSVRRYQIKVGHPEESANHASQRPLDFTGSGTGEGEA